MLTIILGATLVAILFYYFVVKPFNYWKERGVPQGNPNWIVGDNWPTILQLESFPQVVQNIYNQNPGTRYSGMYQFYSPTLLVKDPELLKQITIKDFDHFTDHMNFIPDTADPLYAKNLFSLKGQKWREMRTVLSPSFTSSKMKTMFVLMVECVENFVQHFLQRNEDTITIEMKDVFTRLTNDVIATTAFGVNVDSLGEPNNEFYLMGKKSTDLSKFWKNLKLIGYLIFPKLYSIFNVTFFDEDVGIFFRKVIDDTIKSRKEKGTTRPDMINLLIEAQKENKIHEENDVVDTADRTVKTKELSNEDITAQALVFFFAGFETTSSLMCFMCYELMVDQEIQEKLRKEVYATLKDCGEIVTYEGLLKMKYMDMVVSETLRKWPPTIISDRACTKPYTIPPVLPGEKSVHLEKGIAVWLPIYAVHHDPKNFPDPDRFDPERFSDENKENIKPYTYYPFGLGPRNCIAARFALLESKLLAFYMLQNFQLVPVQKTQIPLKISKKSFNLTAEDGFWVGLKRIKG